MEKLQNPILSLKETMDIKVDHIQILKQNYIKTKQNKNKKPHIYATHVLVFNPSTFLKRAYLVTISVKKS